MTTDLTNLRNIFEWTDGDLTLDWKDSDSDIELLCIINLKYLQNIFFLFPVIYVGMCLTYVALSGYINSFLCVVQDLKKNDYYY